MQTDSQKRTRYRYMKLWGILTKVLESGQSAREFLNFIKYNQCCVRLNINP